MQTSFKTWRESASLIVAAKSNFNRSPNFNYKLLCVKRSSQAGFLPDTYVFPGGNICESDSATLWLKIFEKFGYKPDSFKQLYPTENVPPILQNDVEGRLPKYLSLRICAIRETFEECGILVCKSGKIGYNQKETNWSSYVGGPELLKWQHKVHNDPNEFLNLCSQFEIYPDVWSLQTWSNWKTPSCFPTRFDTLFFLSSFHQMPGVHREEKEIQDIKWATPDEYIMETLEEKLAITVPQFYEISRIKNFTDINSLSKYASKRSCYGCEKYHAHRITTQEGIFNIFPAQDIHWASNECPMDIRISTGRPVLYGDDLYPDDIDKGGTDLSVVDEIPQQSRVLNRMMLRKNNTIVKLLIQNFIPRDKHIPPIP